MDAGWITARPVTTGMPQTENKTGSSMAGSIPSMICALANPHDNQ